MIEQSSEPYTPISCSIHSEYELAIMHKKLLELTWQDADGQERSGLVTPVDLLTRQHQEFLQVTLADHSELQIRLDKIISMSNRSL